MLKPGDAVVAISNTGATRSLIEVARTAKERASVEREVDGGAETLSLTLPAVVTADLRLNEPRYVTLPNIMKAKKKPLVTLTPDELDVEVMPRLRTAPGRAAEVRRGAGVKVADVHALVDKLRNESQVL